MAVTAKQYTKVFNSAFNKELDLNTDKIKVALFASALTASQTGDQYFKTQYSNGQISASNGYTAGGVAITGTVSNPTAKVFMFDGTNPSWTVTGAGFTYRYAVVYASLAATATSPLISYVDFGTDINAVAGTHTIVLDDNGIARVTVA